MQRGLFIVLLCAACHTPEVSSLNLDALHAPGGRHRVYTEHYGSMRYALHALGRGLWTKGRAPKVDPGPVRNPPKRCLHDLLRLTKYAGDGGHVEALQVRQLAHLAVVCPWSLTRERALIDLIPHIERLGELDPSPSLEDVAGPTQLGEALKSLDDLIVRFLRGRNRSEPGADEDIRAACAVVDGLTLDIDGGRRVLELTASYLQRATLARPFFASVRELNDDVQRRIISIALQRALADKTDYVRAAAMRANYAGFGSDFLGDALLAVLGIPTPIETDTASPWPVQLEWVGDEAVFLAVFDLIREHGLPADGLGTDEISMRRRLTYLFALCDVAVNYTTYGDRTRTQAMRALSAASGAGFESIRLEDWQDWWQVEAARVMVAIDEAAEDSGS